MLIRSELRKLCTAWFLPLVLLIAVVIRTVLCIIPSYHEHPYSDEVYKRYTQQLAGSLTEEKTAYLNDRLIEIEELLSVYDEMQQRYTNGEISLADYADYTERHGIADADESTVRYLCSKCEALNACDDLDKQLFYDTAWQELFKDNGGDILLLIGVLCIAVVCFEREYSSGASAVLLTSKHGRAQLCAVKLSCVALSAFLLSLMLSAARLCVFAARTGLDFSELPAGNVLITGALGNKTLLGYYLTDTALKTLTSAMYSILACLITVICRGGAFSFVISFTSFITPIIILNGLESKNAAYLFSASVIQKMYPPQVSPVLFGTVTAVKAALFGVSACILWSRRRK